MTLLTQALIEFSDAHHLGLRDTYAWHQFVWKAFPGRADDPRDFLTRLDRREHDGVFRLLILSPQRPERPDGWPVDETAWQTREIAPAFLAHRFFRFELRANPTRRDHASRKRLPLRNEDELRAWLSRKAEQSGFAVDNDSLRVDVEGREWFRIEKQGRSGFHHAVNFVGMLQVTDTPQFQTAWCKGMGSAKAFGFGLMALVPMS